METQRKDVKNLLYSRRLLMMMSSTAQTFRCAKSLDDDAKKSVIRHMKSFINVGRHLRVWYINL